MEDLYKSLLSSSDTLTEQFANQVFDLTEPEGPVLMLVSPDYQVRANHPTRASFLHDRPEVVKEICSHIEDGFDPCVAGVEGGCIIGTQLATEQAHCGYFLIFLPGYNCETIQTNMDLAELILAQSRIIMELLDKNNQLHHLQLSHLSRKSTVLSSR